MSALSNSEICTFLQCSQDHIKTYSELSKYETIDQLLPHDKSFIILLLEDSKNRGHWTSLMRLGNVIYYFNSYGLKYDRDLSCIRWTIRRILGETKPEIARLCEGHPLEWNHICYQSKTSESCGRYCVVAVEFLCKLGYTEPQFHKQMRILKQKYGSYEKAMQYIVP
jgi:hypothetical protein